MFRSNVKNLWYSALISFALSIGISFAFFGFLAYIQRIAIKTNHEFYFIVLIIFNIHCSNIIIVSNLYTKDILHVINPYKETVNKGYNKV